MSVFVPARYYFDYYSFVVQFEIRVHDASTSVNYFLRLFNRASEIQKVNWRFLNKSIQTQFGQHKVPCIRAINDIIYSPQKYNIILSTL